MAVCRLSVPLWRPMPPRSQASWPNRAASHKRFDRNSMVGHVLETAARPACWSAARPREATSTTTMLISPPPGLGPNGLSRLLLGASRPRLRLRNCLEDFTALHEPCQQRLPSMVCLPTRVAGQGASHTRHNYSNQVEGTARSQPEPYSPRSQ